MVIIAFDSLRNQDIGQNRLGFVVAIIALAFTFFASIDMIYKIIRDDKNSELLLILNKINNVNKDMYFKREKPQIFYVPYPRNRCFIGRDGPLSDLESALKVPGQIQAMIGYNGVGTTQIALEYAYLQCKNYNLIFWIRSNQLVTIDEDYKALANKLGFLVENFENVKAINDAVKSWLESNSRWLLIFDDVKDINDLEDYIPKKIKGNIIITSCNSDLNALANPQYVDIFNNNEAVEFLIKRIGKIDLYDAENLIKIIGSHPLSLELAAAYIKKSKVQVEWYIDNLKNKATSGYNEPATINKTIAAILDISFTEIRKENICSIEILRLCSFFAAEKITKSMLINGLKSLAEKLIIVLFGIEDEKDLTFNLDLLESYSLINQVNGSFIVHSLIQSAVRDELTEDEKDRCISDAIKLINVLFKENDDPNHLLPHALAVSEHSWENNKSLSVARELLSKIGFYLFNQGDLNGAKTALERAIKISENEQQSDISNLDIVFYTLGEIQRNLGSIVDSTRNFEKALKISEKTYGKESPVVARISQKLGLVLRDDGDFRKAKIYLERALQIDLSQMSKDKSIYNKKDIAYDYRILGTILEDLGDTDAAKEYLRKSQEMEEKILESIKFKNILQNNSKLSFDEG